MGRLRVVIVGGGFAGLAAARGLRGAPVDVTLVDQANHHLFQPLLYQVATAALAPSDIAEPLRGVLSGQDNVDVLLGQVERIDVPGRAVMVDGRRVVYDALILAAGARTSWFGHDAWAVHAPGLKTLGDALELRRRILLAFERAEWEQDAAAREALLTFVVVGGGPTGVELAGALREIACLAFVSDFHHVDTRAARVVLVEAGPAVLGPFDPGLRDSARRQLEALGVEVWTGRRVEDVRADGLVVDGELLRAATVLWAAGVAGSPLGAQLGAPVDRAGRVIVEPDLSIPGHPEVMVVGDLAHFDHGLEAPLPGLAPVAMAMGAHAAANLRADGAGRPRTVFGYTDRGTMATIGRSKAVAQVAGWRIAGPVAWLLWVFVHLVTLVGHRNRLVVLLKWAWAWLTFERSSRLIWASSASRPPS